MSVHRTIAGEQWLRFVAYSSTSQTLYLSIRGRLYEWTEVSSQYAEEVESDLGRGFNQHTILKRIQQHYGTGRRARQEIEQPVE